MRKILFFLILFLFSTEKLLANINKPADSVIGCNNEVSEEYLKKANQLKIDQIEIDIHNYRSWIVNSIRILTSRSRYIPERYKRRFDATIVVNYENGTRCVYQGRIRHHGDEKDHISLSDNTIIQSLDVHLNNGNIRGITKFKLLRPKTRGNLNDEILLTELLRNLNYLAPRTIKVDARINEANSSMIFQEKAAKELLEFNKRREGPILEGDEKFFFKTVEKLPDNQLSNWDIGVVPLMNKSVKHMLAKQVNSNIINKGEGIKNMSFNSSTNLNLIYLYYSNKFQDEKNNFHYFDYDLDNTLLGFFDPKKILKLDIYNLLIQSTNSQHGLVVNNRKFYWNSIENYFEPINYDSNSHIDYETSTTTTAVYRLPISQQFFEAFDELENQLMALDLSKVNKNINLSGINMSEEDLTLKINKILKNLNIIKKNYLNIDNKDLVEHNKFKPIDNILDKFNETLNEVDPNVYLVKHSEDTKRLQRCKIFLEMCQDYNFSPENLTDLLEGELILNDQVYQYLGKSLNFENIAKHRNYNKLNFQNSTIFYDDGIKINQTLNENVLDIYQQSSGSRLYIIGGELENLKIKFNSYKSTTNEMFPKNYPTDINGLTGCLSLINMRVKNISIEADGSSCEDAVNFINVKGSVNEINIKNSFSDGLDVDYSELEIKSIKIQKSQNDCVDFSSGKYKLNNLNLENCGDKALSVGEKSVLNLNDIIVKNANIGIASKDSSIVNVNNVIFKNLKTCIAAYNKKQEFNGGFIQINKRMDCTNYNKEADIDVHSKMVKPKI